jgi:hypothetical protein
LTQFPKESATRFSRENRLTLFLELLYFALALALEPPLPMTDDASDAAPLAVATTAPAATLATLRMVLTELPAAAGFLALAGFAATLAATAGTTFLGAALPKAGFASLERAAIAGPAPAFA